MTPKRQRLLFLLFSLALLAVAAGLILTAFQRNLIYFYTPTDVQAHPPAAQSVFRLGGMVQEKSIHKKKGEGIVFVVTDRKTLLPVHYNGPLPNLFREGQGVIAEGTLDAGGTMQATTILAKHDEKYMPPEVARQLKNSGHWKTDYNKP